MKILPVAAELFVAGGRQPAGRTDRMTKLVFAFRRFANAPNITPLLLSHCQEVIKNLYILKQRNKSYLRSSVVDVITALPASHAVSSDDVKKQHKLALVLFS
jgi:hypothetical protein